MDPTVALAISVSTVGIAYFARPIGAIVFGHVSDKYGRKTTMIWTLTVMGVSCVATAILPVYNVIGMLAIALIFVFRFLVGLGLGGESGTGYSWILEARPNSKHRGLFSSFVQLPSSPARGIAVIFFAAIGSTFAPGPYLDWGWRIPFAAGALGVVVAILVRSKLMESPMFQRAASKREVLKYPAFEVIRHEWRKIFTLLWVNGSAVMFAAFVTLPYSVSYLVKMGVGESFANMSVAYGTFFSWFNAVGACISDYIGRKRWFWIGSVFCIAVVCVYFPLLNTLNPLYIILAQILFTLSYSYSASSNRTMFAESFPTKFRASGMGLSDNLASAVTGVVIAFILPGLLVTYGVIGAALPVTLICIAVVLIGVIASHFVKETKGVTLE